MTNRLTRCRISSLSICTQPPRSRRMEQQDGARVSAACLRFAEGEVRDKSPLYGEVLRGAASDPEVIGFLLTLPREKRQPNLFLAAARHLFGTPAGWDQLRRCVLQDKDALRAVMLARSTQTNEPGRCAALLPVLAGLPEPLALLEVGASAGLCLLPDFYGYDYGRTILGPEAPRSTPPVFPCTINAATPVPAIPPRVVWRAGLDLNPVDLSVPGEVDWLEALIRLEQTDRLARLRAAIKIAAEQKPRLVKGDLRTDLAALAREAPKDATLVIFHTAVLAYVSCHADRPRPSEYCSRTAGSYPSAPPARHVERCPETPAASRSRSKNRRARRLIARTPPVPPRSTRSAPPRVNWHLTVTDGERPLGVGLAGPCFRGEWPKSASSCRCSGRRQE